MSVSRAKFPFTGAKQFGVSVCVCVCICITNGTNLPAFIDGSCVWQLCEWQYRVCYHNRCCRWCGHLLLPFEAWQLVHLPLLLLLLLVAPTSQKRVNKCVNSKLRRCPHICHAHQVRCMFVVGLQQQHSWVKWLKEACRY